MVGLAIWAYLEPGWMTSTSVALVGLLALRESRQFLEREIINLEIDGPDSPVAVEQRGQSHFYVKYKVYATRWFAILKLIDNRNTRTLILNSDRFNSIQTYRQLRLVLQTMDRTDAA